MSDLAMVWLNLIVGILLGAFFFGGLWWTVRKVVAGDGMEFWLSISLLIRSSVTLAGFYFSSAGHWQYLLADLVGFIVARSIIKRLAQGKEASHAPES